MLLADIFHSVHMEFYIIEITLRKNVWAIFRGDKRNPSN